MKSVGSKRLVSAFFQFQTELKLYHWRTLQYSRHKASDHLHQTILPLFDRFIEAYMGEFGRVHCTPSIPVRVFDDQNVSILLKGFIHFLESLTETLEKQTYLINIRDEILSECRQAQYLFTLT